MGTQPTSTLRGICPPIRQHRISIGEYSHMQQERRESRLADRSLRDRTRQRRLSRIEAELGAEQRHEPRLLGRPENGLTLRYVSREGFFADQMFPRGDRLQCDFRVAVRRGGDRHRTDVRECECIVDRDESQRYFELLCPAPGLYGVATHDCADLEARLSQGANVGEATETCTKHDDAELSLIHVWSMGIKRGERTSRRRGAAGIGPFAQS